MGRLRVSRQAKPYWFDRVLSIARCGRQLFVASQRTGLRSASEGSRLSSPRDPLAAGGARLWLPIVALILFATIIPWPAPWQTQPGQSERPTGLQTIILAGHTYTLPWRYLRATQLSGEVDQVRLVFVWPDLGPPDHPITGVMPDNRVSVLGSGDPIPDPDRLIYRYLEGFIRFGWITEPEEERRFGLVFFEGTYERPPSIRVGDREYSTQGMWSGEEEYYFDSTEENAAYYMRCGAPNSAPNPSCIAHFYWNDTLWNISFNRNYIESWNEIRSGFLDLMESFSTN